jgi:hypothetical protein
MTIEQIDVIDFVSLAPNANEVMLTISDHLDWDDELQHLSLLQAKLNAYLRTIAPEDLCAMYPAAEGRKPVIEIRFRVPPPDAGVVPDFLAHAAGIVRAAGGELRWHAGKARHRGELH